MSKIDFDEVYKGLTSSNDEEEFIDRLTTIIKSYDINLYKDLLINNPYFKVLISDIAKNILIDVSKIKESILSLINTIECSDEDLSDLLKTCLSLLERFEIRESEIKSLI